jgi:hypothetical protein
LYACRPVRRENVAEGVLQAESLPSGVTEVSNVAISENLEIASQQDTTVTIPADESRTRYQLVAPSADILGAITVIAKNTTDQTVVRELALELYDHATEARLARLPRTNASRSRRKRPKR